MSRDIPFEPYLKCDRCGKLGAFDFVIDALCGECAFLYLDFTPQENENDAR